MSGVNANSVPRLSANQCQEVPVDAQGASQCCSNQCRCHEQCPQINAIVSRFNATALRSVPRGSMLNL
ncbi:hypothetical protein E2C01_067081 [Portunus trituberculatus]|uniref:Uncharacterized protein n=1 Tax=Portunus trituberculatus TaxID=210409 RepID=A0A5B7HVL9_PORTR|nr:hypothetical protein [Portunus trituberculatus]